MEHIIEAWNMAMEHKQEVGVLIGCAMLAVLGLHTIALVVTKAAARAVVQLAER